MAISNSPINVEAYAHAAEQARARIGQVLGLAKEFPPNLEGAIRVLALDTTESVQECRRIVGLLAAAAQPQGDEGWAAAHRRVGGRA
jgi:hypothetical protein